MVQFATFEIERWLDVYEEKVKYDLFESCSLSILLKDLLEFSYLDGEPKLEDSKVFKTKLGYGPLEGSQRLRERIAKIYKPESQITANNILITQGAIGANFLSVMGSVKDGDHAIVVSPTFQQLQELPRSFGASVSFWQLKPETGWKHDVNELKKLITKKTTLIVINNPNNPTGQIITDEQFLDIHSAMKQKASPTCKIMCDEVFSPLWHSLSKGEQPPSSLLELNVDNVFVTGSLSKAYSLAGIRIGWIASKDRNFLDSLVKIRDYNVVSISAIDEEVASRALGEKARQTLLERNIQLAIKNRQILQDWIESTPGIHWTPTKAGTTAMVYLGDGIDDAKFCGSLCENTGVSAVPAGLCFGQKGYVRIGYVGKTDQLKDGLRIMAEHLAQWKKKEGLE